MTVNAVDKTPSLRRARHGTEAVASPHESSRVLIAGGPIKPRQERITLDSCGLHHIARAAILGDLRGQIAHPRRFPTRHQVNWSRRTAQRGSDVPSREPKYGSNIRGLESITRGDAYGSSEEAIGNSLTNLRSKLYALRRSAEPLRRFVLFV